MSCFVCPGILGNHPNLLSSIVTCRVSDASGELHTDLVKTGHLSQEDLQGQDAFLVNGGSLGVFVWLGEQEEEEEGQETNLCQVARAPLKRRRRP